MQKNSKKKIKTFSVGFNESEYDESNFAKSVSKRIGSQHHDIKVDLDDMLQHVEKIATIVVIGHSFDLRGLLRPIYKKTSLISRG